MEEISLREVIQIIFRGKWIIAIFTTICVLVSGITSFFFFTPVYEAQTMLMISPISNTQSENKENNSFFNLVGDLSKYPQMTVETYKEQIKTPEMIDHIRNEMGWTDQTLATVSNKITVSSIKNTNLITIKIKDKNPQSAAKAANLLSGRFTLFVSETNKKQAENAAEFIKKQQEEERINQEKVLQELRNFIAQPRGPEELRLELEAKLQQLTDFKTQVVQVKIDEEATRYSLENGESILKSTPTTLKTNKSLINDELLSGVVKDKIGGTTSDIASIKLNDEQVNEIYVEVSKKVNELKIQLASLTAQRQNIESQISIRQKEIDVLQAELAEKQQKYDMLNHEVELSKQTYDAYQQKYKEAMIKSSAEVGKSSITIISKAIEPKKPIAPNKALNITIAMVLGLMLGTFTVTIMEYCKKNDIFYKNNANL